MELYGYMPHPYSTRSPTNHPRSMHSTLSFPGSSTRRGSVPVVVTNGITDALGSPASLASARLPHTPINRVQPSVRSMKSGIEESPKRPRTAERIARARKRTVGPDAHVLEEELQRLMQSCHAYEVKIKESKARIEEQLFPQLNNAISNLADIDNEADTVSLSMDDALSSARPALTAKTSHILQIHREKIAQTESTSSPWRDLARIASVEEEHLEISEDEGDGIHTSRDGESRILHLGGRRNGSMGMRDGGDGSLEKVKGWAEEVKNYLTSEIAVLNARQEAGERKGRKRSLVRWVTLAVLVILLSIFLPLSKR